MHQSAEPAAIAAPRTTRRGSLPAVLLRPEVWGGISVCAASVLLALSMMVAFPVLRGGARTVSLPVAGPITFYVLPDLVADLKSSRSRPHYVQLSTVVELPQESLDRLREKEVEIVADIQVRLRDLYKTDLVGSAGVERLREDVRATVDHHIAPARAHGVLFTRFLVD